MSKPRIAKVAGRPNWHIVWSENGKTQRRSTGTNQIAEAEAELDAFIEERGGRRPEKLLPPHIIDAYIEMRRPVISSVESLEYRAKPLKRVFARRLPSMIRREHIQSYTEKRRKIGVSNSSIRSELSLLQSSLKYALAEGWISKVPHFELPPPNSPKDRWLTVEEVDKLIDACRSYHVRLFCIVALNAAARRGAIQDLTWEQVDMENRRIDFNPNGRMQTKKRRVVVPINETLFTALEEAKERATSEYVIEYAGMKLEKINDAFRRAAKRAGLNDVTPNTLRHTCATWMAQAGVDLWQIAGMLGHADIKTTIKHYAKHHPDYLNDAASALDQAFRRTHPKQKRRRKIRLVA